MLPLILNSLFVVKYAPYSMIHINNFVGTICKSNMRSLNVIMVALNNWNKLPNQVKLISSYTSYKVFIKTMLLDSYEWDQYVYVIYVLSYECITIASFKWDFIYLCNKYTYYLLIIPSGIVLL